jgi:hypothetical protein
MDGIDKNMMNIMKDHIMKKKKRNDEQHKERANNINQFLLEIICYVYHLIS